MKKFIDFVNESESSSFTYDLNEMIIAMESPRIKVPVSAISTDEAFEAWLNS